LTNYILWCSIDYDACALLIFVEKEVIIMKTGTFKRILFEDGKAYLKTTIIQPVEEGFDPELVRGFEDYIEKLKVYLPKDSISTMEVGIKLKDLFPNHKPKV
jgi:hypothetical protein